MDDKTEEVIETVPCKLCRQEIAKPRHRMHELGCLRQNYWCETCELAVPKAEKEEHDETMHIMKQCSFCGLQMMAMHLPDHEASCDQKPAGCPFCDEQIAPSALLDHMNICGAKTYLCGKCGEYVKRAEKRDHDDSYCQVIQESKKEMQEQELQQAKKDHQKKLLSNWDKEEAKLPVISQPPVQASSILDQPNAMNEMPNQMSNGGADLSAYEQMLFQQFASGDDEGAAAMRQFGQQADPSQQMPSDQLGIRQADSQREQQLLGGSDDSPGSQPAGMFMRGGMQHGFFQNPLLQRQPGMIQSELDPGVADEGSASSLNIAQAMHHMQTAFQHSHNMGGMQAPQVISNQVPAAVHEGESTEHHWPDDDEEIPAEDLDEELQAALEASKNDK